MGRDIDTLTADRLKKMTPFAHSLAGLPESRWEPLAAHLSRVAARAGCYADAFEATDYGTVVGLWHDFGKYRHEFQKRIRGERILAPHAAAGAALAWTRNSSQALPAAFAIAGHHAGLSNLSSAETGPDPLKQLLKSAGSLASELEEVADESIRSAMLPGLPAWLHQRMTDVGSDGNERTSRIFAFFTRMLFSTLVDADRVETAAFYAEAEARPADHELLDYDSLHVLQRRLDAHIDRLSAACGASLVNSLRADVLAACRSAALQSPGLFSLTVPTGGGKTLSAMSFALNHAIQHDLRRVIVVIPFTSIIRQNAERYRDAFGPNEGVPDDRNVLEHHSSIDDQRRRDENPESELRRQIAAENWDAPVIVTTTVQFFESLFSSHPSRCRKLHRIAGSVIILDEVQTLPPGLLLPILEALQELASNYHCSIVLSTATPPALEQSPQMPAGLRDVRPIIADSARLFASPASRRVKVEWRINCVTEWNELADELASHSQVLVIVHRRADAHELYELLPEGDRLHLSAMMCPAHRVERISEIEKRLKAGQPCRLISTQLIEAGVDVDFPVVYRALAGVDSLAQSAGRCDREGRRSEQAGQPAGRFVVFRAPTLPPPGTLRTAMQATEALFNLKHDEPELAGGLDIFNPRHGQIFFREFYFRKQLDEMHILRSLSGLNFATVDRDFQMIADQGMRPLVVPWREGMERADRYRRSPSRETARALQPYIVQVNRRYFDTVVERGLFESCDDSIGLPTGLCTPDWYSDEFGLERDSEREVEPDVLIL